MGRAILNEVCAADLDPRNSLVHRLRDLPANGRIAGQIQRLPNVRRQLVCRDRSCLNSVGGKKPGNDQVCSKSFACTEGSPVPFAVVRLCIGDLFALCVPPEPAVDLL